MKKLILALLLISTSAWAQQQVPVVSGSVTIPVQYGQSYFSVVLNQNVTSFSITGIPSVQAQHIEILFREAGSGGYTVTGLASNISGSFAISTAAGISTSIGLSYDSNNNTWFVTGGTGGSLPDAGNQVYNVKAFGAKGDGTTNDTAAFTAAVNAAVANHGGTILVPASPKAYILSPDFTLPNDGAPSGAAFANQYPIKIEGTVARQSQANGTETNLYDTTSGSIIKFTTAATNADIVTLGQGNLEISGITFLTTTCSPFILTTQTTLRIYDDLFVGSAAFPNACNDGIILGGTSTTAGALSPNLNFGGFGTIIRGNTFKSIRRMVLAQTYADNWFLEKNVYSATSGTAAYCAVEINDPNNLGSLGGYVLNTRFEMSAALCALKSVNATNPVFAFNDIEDFTGGGSSVVDLTNSPGAQIYAGFGTPPIGTPYVKTEDSTSNSYNFINNSTSSTLPSQIFSLQPTTLQMQNNGGLASYDSSGNKIDTSWSSGGEYYFRYTPNGSGASNLWGFTVNGSSVGNMTLNGTSQDYFLGYGSLYNGFKSATSGAWALLGDTVDTFALGIDPSNASVRLDKYLYFNSTDTIASVRTGSASNRDLAGQLTLSSGSASYTFGGTYTSAPVCTANDTTGANAVQVTTTVTTLTLTGTGSDVINYICMGRN